MEEQEENIVYNDPRRVIRGSVYVAGNKYLVIRYHPEDRNYFQYGEKVVLVIEDWVE